MLFWNSKSESVLPRIVRSESKLESKSDAELLEESRSLRFRMRGGENRNALLPTAFALIKVASQRTIGKAHYPVQMQGGAELSKNAIIEMQTGEGKTLTATLPLYLFALQGKGAHLATANDYLAERDADTVRPIFELLGLTVGVITTEMGDQQRRDAYACDVTYGTITEFGFDFLRDRLKIESNRSLGPFDDAEELVMRDLFFIVADEADSVLIDEANMPLIIGAPGRPEKRETSKRVWANSFAEDAVEKKHFYYNLRQKKIELTNIGRRWARSLIKGRQDLKKFSFLELYEALERAIQVNRDFKKDTHYIVQDNDAVIVNEQTGRIGVGQTWMDGIHQAVQAAEGMDITAPETHAGKITIQSFFMSYRHRSGMTGTAVVSRNELRKIYKMRTSSIPTHRPCIRQQLPNRSFRTENEKWESICEEIEEVSKTGRPVLVGTRSVEKSAFLSRKLLSLNVDHYLLNAPNHDHEAKIIADAGNRGRVTVATHMAGRGTDILLSDEVVDAGGLHVIISEIADSSRIDRQLAGRSARQGQPGSFRCYYSLDDDVIELAFGLKKANEMRGKAIFSDWTKLAKLSQAKLSERLESNRRVMLYHDKRRLRKLWQMGFDPVVGVVG